MSVVGLSAQAGTALAESAQAGFYVGVAATTEFLEASYDKSTDNTDPRNVSAQQGQVFHDDDAAKETGYGAGLLGGYRLPLDDHGLYLIGEVDAMFHGGKVEGRLLGSPPGQDFYQYGESWPETWSFQEERSVGLTLKLGGSPAFLSSWAGSDSSIYGLAGVRHVKTNFKIHYTGCLDAETPCKTKEDLVSGTEDWDRDFLAWVGGVGLEKMIGEKIALRGEVRYTWYQRESWISLPDEGKVRVPAALDNEEIGLAMHLVRYF